MVELIKIRTLADAGVPLSRVHELLAAVDPAFATAITEIDQPLRAEIRERQQHRQRIAMLAAGDSLALPPEAVTYLQALRAVGVSDEMVDAGGWSGLKSTADSVLGATSEEVADKALKAKVRRLEEHNAILKSATGFLAGEL